MTVRTAKCSDLTIDVKDVDGNKIGKIVVEDIGSDTTIPTVVDATIVGSIQSRLYL